MAEPNEPWLPPDETLPDDPDGLVAGWLDADEIERFMASDMSELEVTYRRLPAEPGSPFVLFDDIRANGELLAAAPLAEFATRLRLGFAAKHGYRPRLSLRHVLAVGQPNVVGNAIGPPTPAEDPGWPARAGKTTRPVLVAIVDTWMGHHPWIAGAYLAAPEDVLTEFAVRVDGEKRFGIQAAHALFLVGLVLRQAPGATIRVLRTADHNGSSEVHRVAEAISTAARLGADVINLSLGCHTTHDLPPWTLQDAIADVPPTTAIVAAAGNRSTSRAFWPAALPRVTAVGGLAGDAVAGFSNHGPWVQVYVDATDVVSTYLNEDASVGVPDADGRLEPKPERYSQWATWSGTSMAAASWSGAVARIAGQVGVDGARAQQIVFDDPAAAGIPRFLVPGDGASSA
jgi:hypothetical protein